MTTQQDQARALYDRLAPMYGPMAGWWEGRSRQAGLEALAAQPGERILEIGCGPGAALAILARSVRPDGRVVGVDISPRMCAVSRRAVRGLPVEVVEGAAARLPFPERAFDGCFLSFTLELFEEADRQVVLAECRRILRPNGRIVVVGLSDEGQDTLMRRVYRHGHCRFPHVLDCRPIRVAEALRQAGFRQVTASVIGMWGLPVEVAAARVD